MKELGDVLEEALRLRMAVQDQFWRLGCALKELTGSEPNPLRELILGVEAELRRAAMSFDARCRQHGVEPFEKEEE